MLAPAWLSSFLAVAETLSFTAAAGSLGVGQSTVSEHVRKLERACGRRLFVRDTHAVRLTPAGEAMRGFAASILDTQARALRHFGDQEVEGSVRLGVSEDVVLSGLPRALRQFTRDHPRVELELMVGLSEALHESLRDGELDLAVLKRRPGDTHGDLLWRELLVWIAAKDFKLHPQRPAPLVLLAPPALTRAAALAALEGQGRPWRIVCTSRSQSGVHAAVAAGLGVAPHARSLAPEGLVEIGDPDLPTLGEIEFVVLGGRGARSGPGLALADAIRDSGEHLRSRDAWRSGR